MGKCDVPNNLQYISNMKFCCFSCIIALVHQNTPSGEFCWEKIEGNLRRANIKPSMDFGKNNTKPS